MTDFPLTIFLADLQATRQLGKLIAENLSPGSVLLLEGDLGAGKTSLVQGIGEGLGIKDVIVSPTFTIVNEYHEGHLPLYHLDLYRLETEEIKAIYPETYWEGIEVTPGITAIEWAQRLPYQPDQYLDIQLIHTSDQGRQVIIKPVGMNLTQQFLSDLSCTFL